MKLGVSLFAVSVWAAAVAGTAFAADISRLEWGGFVVESDSSDGWDSFKSASSDDGNSVAIAFSSLDAKADGATLESRASMSGHYDLSQPESDRYAALTATLEGHVIKSGNAVTRTIVRIGSTEKIFDWPQGATASEKFTREMDVALPADGKLPSPLVVSIETYARKDGPSDAAYMSVGTLTITASGTRVAGN